MRAVVFTLGCKVNEVESAQILAALEKSGFEVDDKLSPADVYVLNTCAVTAEAEKKSRQLIARAKKFNPNAKVYACGCACQKSRAAFEDKGISFVSGTGDKLRVVSQILRDFNFITCVDDEVYPKLTKTRAFIKIGDGCNNFCSYCIIPYLRGRVNCRKVSDVVKEVNATEAQEIVLTAINISAYNDGENDLTGLIKALSFCDKRIRLGSLECRVIDDDLLTALKRLKDFAPQFHLSLQSGSNAVLKSMNRHYTAEEYRQKCSLIYKYFPDAAITTDIIVGFPTETEADFNDSLSMIEAVKFARVHAFAFSPREGTVAYSMKDVSKDVKSRRLHTLLQRAKEHEREYISCRNGKEYDVIFEDFDGEYTGGYTPNYVRVYIKGDYRSQKLRITLREAFRDGALATKVNYKGE